jgi:serine/threonine-protein kinase
VAEKLDALPTQTLGSYQVRSKIGSGGMGDVFDAVHTGLDKRVAIKTLRKRFLDDEVVVARFLREGQLASRIRHPNIVDVTDVGMMGGLPCLVMEHLEGESFSQLIRREGKLSVDRIVDILLPIIAAVDFAHDHGIVHRDLKPSNIYLSRAWNGEIVPKVLDFGISKLVHEAQEAALTTDSAFVGTPHYASPELMRADRQADGRSDQYSMGVILYEAATGQRPFLEIGNNFVALAMAICKGEYPPARERNPNIPLPFDNVIKRTMALHPEERFLTMRDLGAALLPFASERARMIWAPTFQARTGEAPVVGEVLGELRASGPASATVQVTPASMSRGGAKSGLAASGSNPSFPSQASGGVPSLPGPPVSMPPPSFGSDSHPSTTPPGAAFDRLPTYPTYGTGRPVAPPRGNGLITAIVGGSVVLAIIVALVVLKGGLIGGAKKDDKAAASATPAVVTYAIDLAVTPATATIELDGAPVGSGRLVQTMTKDGRVHRLAISAPGYETVRTEFDDVRPPPTTLVLRPLPSAPSSTPTPVTGGTKPAGGKPSGGKKGDNRPKTDNIDPWE